MNIFKATNRLFPERRSRRRQPYRRLEMERFESRELLATYVLDWHNGSDNNPCTEELPCKSYLPFVTTYGQSDPNIGKLRVLAGDLIIVWPGEYTATYEHPDAGPRAFHWRNVHGEPGNEIRIVAQPGAVFNATAPDGSEVAKLSLQDSSYIRVEGLEVTGHGDGIVVTSSSHITLADNWIHDVHGESNSLIAGINVESSSHVTVHDNLIHDNYDRAKPAFNSFNVEFQDNDGPIEFRNNVVFNTDANVAGGTGPAVKHSGEGLLHIHHNVIRSAANAGIAADTRRALVHHNLVLDSSPIRIHPNYTAREETLDVNIFNNSVIDLTPEDNVGGGLYVSLDQQANPGMISFDRNLVVHQEAHSIGHGIMNVAPYGSDPAYAQWMPTGRFSADGNVYHSPSHELFFDVFSATTRGREGGLYSFAQWQAQGYDRHGLVANPRLDDAFVPQIPATVGAGWYAGESPRLTVLVVGKNLINEGEETRVAVVRSGDGLELSEPLTVTLDASDSSEVALPSSVRFDPGQAKVYLTVRGIQDRESDGTRATRISASANGFTNDVSDWLRIVDVPFTPDPDPTSNPAPRYKDGVLTLPGVPHETVHLHFNWIQRLAQYNNELGVVVADAPNGTVDGLATGTPGYAKAALQSPTRQTIFASGAGAGDTNDLAFDGGDSLVFYLVQNATAEDWLRENPSNDLSDKPVIFFSTEAANPDDFDHVRVTEADDGTIRFAWEDLVDGGDFSFTDALIDVAMSTATATAGYTDGVLTLPGNSNETVTLHFNWVQRLAQYDNELGIVVADAADGTVAGLAPSQTGYAEAVLRRPNRRTIFASGTDAGATNALEFSGGQPLVFYLIQNATVDDWLRKNPSNDPSTKPVAFFSTPAANPDVFEHVRVSDEGDGNFRFAWEDLVGGGDLSFTDAVIDVTWNSREESNIGPVGAQSGNSRPSSYASTPAAEESGSGRNLDSERQSLFDVNADGLISPLDVLLIVNHLRSLVADETTAAPAIFRASLDTNKDGQVSSIDALLVINALNSTANTASEGESPKSIPLVRSDCRTGHDQALLDIVEEFDDPFDFV